jgi:SAM-dependent methyltransferase
MILERMLAHLVQATSSLIDRFSLEPKRISSHDRLILEKTILPYLATIGSYRKILFVGCSAYTQWYQEFFNNKEYWTIDPIRAKKKYAADRHLIDSITNVRKYIDQDYFDVILMNGVIGFGLNQLREIEQAVEACYEVLAQQGILLIGWNDTRRRTPVDLRSVRPLRKFREYYFEPLQASHFRADGPSRHTYSFYRKE